MGKETSSKQRIAWGRYLLVLFVAAWMFVLGVMVGRGRAPVEFDTQALTKELSALRTAMVKKQQDAIEKAVIGENENQIVDFHEALQKDRPDTAVDITANTPQSSASESRVTKTPHKTRAPLLEKKRDRAGTNKPPKTTSQSTETTTSSSDRMTIQVAALKDAAAAEKIVTELKNEGYSAYLSRLVVPDQGLWLRVRIGSYGSSEEAAQDMARLKNANRKPILVEK